GNGLKFDPSSGLMGQDRLLARINAIQTVIGSREFLTREVRAAYREILGRDPLTGGVLPLFNAAGQVVRGGVVGRPIQYIPTPTTDNPLHQDVVFVDQGARP